MKTVGRFDHRHLHLHGTSPVHRLPPHTKVAGLVLFVVVVALTPRRFVPAFVLDAIVLGAVIGIAGLPLRKLAVRLASVLPFVAFALLLPFFGGGDQTQVGPVALSTEGLWGAWNVLAKATLGATAAIVVTATTPVPDLLSGLARLRVPAVIVGIMSFMFRYLDLIVDQLASMRRAMVARAHDPRWLWQARPIAASAGTLFVRTYERGERVHGAMAARGFTGELPDLGSPPTTTRSWFAALTPALFAGSILLTLALTR